jgi:2-dehydro-3-deoxyglucarate aldolase
MHDMTPPEYMAAFNREVTVAIQIETKNAVDTIEEILEVDGIDLITFGAQDLAQSYGHPGLPDHSEVVEAMESVVTAVHARGRLMSSDVERGINLVQWLPERLQAWLAESKSK